MKKQIVRSGLILACGLLTTVAYMTATDQPANSSSGSAVQQPAVAVFRFVPQSKAVTDTAVLSPAADAAASPSNVGVDPLKAQNTAIQASLNAPAAGELKTVDVAAVVARLNRSVSEFIEERAAAVDRYPTLIITPWGPTFIMLPKFH
ncbi:MAG: hypothetical protein WA718_09950 [Terriglobales bacterium]